MVLSLVNYYEDVQGKHNKVPASLQDSFGGCGHTKVTKKKVARKIIDQQAFEKVLYLFHIAHLLLEFNNPNVLHQYVLWSPTFTSCSFSTCPCTDCYSIPILYDFDTSVFS